MLVDRAAPGHRGRGGARCGSTRASASARRSSTTCPCSASLGDLVATGYPVLVGHQPQELPRVAGPPARTGRRPRSASGSRLRWPPPPGPWSRGRGWCGSTTSPPPSRPAGAWSGVRPDSAGRTCVKGKWAAGIPPRNFTWVIKDRLAMSERPGGFAPNHRKVRRQEEIIWLQVQGFTRVVSLLPSSHNLQAYEERSMASVHFPLPAVGRRPGGAGRPLPRPARPADRRGADPHPPRGAGRPGDRGGGRLPAVVGPAARAGPRPSPCSST